VSESGREAGDKAKKKVSLAFLGDGALNQGALHEAMNLAGLYSLPVIYVVENNGYSMGTAIERGTTMAHDLRKKADAYGIRGEIIDGFDVIDLYDDFKPLVDWCRENQRPAFVDLKTYRYLGHSMSDPQKYRTKEEVDQFKSKDSIDRLASQLMGERKGKDGKPILSEARFTEIQTEVKESGPQGDGLRRGIADARGRSRALLRRLHQPAAEPEPDADYIHGVKNPLL
jgi:pyruvate dehydrogenase E1 component alpha subunit